MLSLPVAESASQDSPRLPRIRFLVPGTSGKYRCGGLLVELQTARILSRLIPTDVVTYRRREPAHPFLADLLRTEDAAEPVRWIVSWGFDVPALLRKLKGRSVLYHAHSCGYDFDLPPGVPVVAVSRNTLGYWGNRAPRNPLFLVPNALDSQWVERGARGQKKQRAIDVLVQRRKNSAYVLEQLVPALRAVGLRVDVQDGWVDDLVGLFNEATVVLYDSADYWRSRGLTEGFGLPPIEALAAGCVVFSSFNHALADLLEPGTVGHQIGCGRLSADVERICAAVRCPADWLPDSTRLEMLLDGVSEESALEGWRRVLSSLGVVERGSDPPLISLSSWRLRWRQRRHRLMERWARWLGALQAWG